MVIEAKSKGKCVTRNGESAIESIRLESYGPNGDVVKIGFVSERLKRELHAGATIDAKAMDSLALQWIAKRGLAGKPVCEVDHGAIGMALEDASVAIGRARGELSEGRRRKGG